jgi:signal transduction histidine kinase
MRRSIRWELPLSYAAIALLATVALGAVLLVILRGYYSQLERSYLEGNALAFSYTLAPLLEEDRPPESLQAQLISLSFLSQARVRLLDENGSLVADSNTPGRFVVSFAARSKGDMPVPAGKIEVGPVVGPLLVISSTVTETVTLPSAQALPLRLLLESSRSGDPYAPFRIRLPFFGAGEYPLDQRSDADSTGSHPGPVVRQPIYDDSVLLGYVELSGGPAYAREIVGDVAWGWGIASTVAVLLAAAAGWLVSRRISAPLLALTDVTASMAGGNLSARADASRRDEFGTLARSFNTMADQVEDTVVTLRRFVSDAAHELNTPLATLRTNLEMMRQDSLPGQDSVPTQDSLPGQNERVARAQAQVERLEILTRGMLDLSRIEAGMNQGALGPVSLTALAQEMGELYASRAEQAGLTFELSLPQAAILIQGDEGQLRQALTNLLDNAIKFTPDGGRVGLGLEQAEGMATLWVEDTGIGIPEEDRPHLFQRFHRGRNTEGYPGSGLGLAIVKAIADRHGGSVAAEGTDQGTRISLRFPC